jgi:hypothetical protein
MLICILYHLFLPSLICQAHCKLFILPICQDLRLIDKLLRIQRAIRSQDKKGSYSSSFALFGLFPFVFSFSPDYRFAFSLLAHFDNASCGGSFSNESEAEHETARIAQSKSGLIAFVAVTPLASAAPRLLTLQLNPQEIVD